MEMTPFLILRKALLGVSKLGDKRQIWCLCQINSRLRFSLIELITTEILSKFYLCRNPQLLFVFF